MALGGKLGNDSDEGDPVVKKVVAQQDECRQITEDCQLAEPLGVEKTVASDISLFRWQPCRIQRCHLVIH